MTPAVLLLTLLLECLTPMGLQQSSSRPAAPPTRPPAAGKVHREFYLPPAMSRDEWERSASILRLSAEQRTAAESFVEDYQRQQAALAKAVLPALLAQSEAVGASMHSEGFDVLLSDRAKVVATMVAIDETFFTSLDRILADSQRPNLKRVRDIREHAMARIIPSRVPGSSENVSRLVLDICDADPTAAVDTVQLEALSSDYDATSALLWKAHERRMLQAFILEFELFGPTLDPMAAETNSRNLKRVQEFSEGTYKLEERLRELNVNFVNNVEPFLSRDAAALLRLRYYSSAYPEVYPDPHDVSAVLTCLEIARANDATVEAALKNLRTVYLERHAAISARMVERHLAWRAWFTIHGVNDHAEFDAYKDSMLAMQAERAAAANTVLSQALDTIGETPASCVVVVADYREKVAKHESQVMGFVLRP